MQLLVAILRSARPNDVHSACNLIAVKRCLLACLKEGRTEEKRYLDRDRDQLKGRDGQKDKIKMRLTIMTLTEIWLGNRSQNPRMVLMPPSSCACANC